MTPAEVTSAADGRRGAALAVACVVLTTFSLRTALASVSPIVPEIGRALEFNAVLLGLLGTLPPLGFAAAGLFSPMFSRTLGLEVAMVVSMSAMTAAHAVRAVAADVATFFASTSIILLAAGVGGILIPPFIKARFPGRAGPMTAIYVCTISLGTALPPAAAVPISDLLGWRASLGVWAAVALGAALPWVVLARRSRRPAPATSPAPRTPVPDAQLGPLIRMRLFWALALAHGTNTFFTFTVFAWLPVILLETGGVTPGYSGPLLGLFAVITIPLALALPWLLGRTTRHDLVVYVFAAALVLGWGGLLLFPGLDPLAWVVLMAVGAGLFVVYQLLLVRRTPDQEATARMSGYTQTFGYLFGACGPVLVGLLKEATGSWMASLLLMVMTGALVFVTGFLLRPDRRPAPRTSRPPPGKSGEPPALPKLVPDEG